MEQEAGIACASVCACDLRFRLGTGWARSRLEDEAEEYEGEDEGEGRFLPLEHRSSSAPYGIISLARPKSQPLLHACHTS